MRRFLALARTAALESLAEPLTAVLFLSGFAVTHLAPAFHYHQFGESGRLARECGFSALLVFGLVFAPGAARRTIGREIESGTAAAALALAVPRTLFLAARLAGVLASFALFAAAIPNYDGDRFYVSHMRKVVDWYNELVQFASLDFEDEQEKEN